MAQWIAWPDLQNFELTTATLVVTFEKDDESKCKIKRTDFGFEWPIKNFTGGEVNG